MPPSRSDARALVFAIGSLVLAGIVVAAFLLWATRTDGPPTDVEGNRVVPVGQADQRTENLAEEGPVYFPNPFGEDGFWLALEDGQVVALALRLPGRPDCAIGWRAQEDTFKDCDDEPVDTTEVDRYEMIVPTEGDATGELFVNLDVRVPAPAG